MTLDRQRNRVRDRRLALGLTQASLAERAGISRTAISAIEGARLVPSVAAALALARILECTVEELFGIPAQNPAAEVWASPDIFLASLAGRGGGRTVLYPAESAPMLTMLPDERSAGGAGDSKRSETLVIACCDPAAGMLASHFAATTGMRMLVLRRSTRQAIEMLRDGLVHLAGLHLSTRKEPLRNDQLIQSSLGDDFQSVRVARWQEGIAAAPRAKLRSVRAAVHDKLAWVGREPGSGARECLDRLLGSRPGPRHIARHHRGVAEAIVSGWADVGVCVQLVSAEAGLDFLPVQEEEYDVCFPKQLEDDVRIKAFLGLLRSTAFRKLFGELPGYDTSESGALGRT